MYNRTHVFASACAGILLFGASIVSLGTVNAYLTTKFSLESMAVGSLAALLPFGILAGSLIFGPIVDRYGFRLPLIIATLMILGGFEAIAFTDSFAAIQFAFFLIGLGGGVINGGTSALVADISSEGKGASLSLLGVFFGVGALGMPALTGILLHSASYETIVACLGLGALIPAGLFSSIPFPPPKQAQGFPLKRGLSMLRHPALLLLSFALFFQSGLEGMANNWGTMYLQQHLRMSVGDSLLGLTVLGAALTFGRILMGWLLKRFRPSSILLSCIALAFSGGLALKLATTPWMAVMGMALMGFGFAPVFPVVLGFIADLFAELSGTAFGIALVIALAGNTFLNYLVGALSDWVGITVYPLIHVAATIALTVLVLFARRKLPSHANA